MDFLEELEAELSVNLEKIQREKAAEAARKAANNMRMPKAFREQSKEEYLALKAQIEADQWAVEASVAMFTEQRCDGCGSTHRTFLQYMERQYIVKKPSTLRWVRVTSARADVPRETLVQPMTTHICADCCEDHGFALEGPSRSDLPARGLITTSTTYAQDDINGPA